MYQNKEYKGIKYAVCNIGKSIEFTVIQFSWILWVQVHTSHTYVYIHKLTPLTNHITHSSRCFIHENTVIPTNF